MSETDTLKGRANPALPRNMASPLLAGLMPLDQAAADLGKRHRTIRRWIAAGMPVIRLGGDMYVDIEKVRAWIANHETGGLKPSRGRKRS